MTKRPQQGVAQHGVTLVVRWAIVGALTVLLISMATGQYGISNYVALQRNKDELERANMKLLVENQLIDEKIETLRTSKAAQLHYLKDVFGYVEKGESVYHFPSDTRFEVRGKAPPSPSRPKLTGRQSPTPSAPSGTLTLSSTSGPVTH